MLRYILIFLLIIISTESPAPPLETFQTFTTDNPLTSKRGLWTQWLARGTGTDDFYVVEVDPANGALPVSIVAGSLVLGYDTDYGVVGSDTLRTAAQIGNATGAAAFGNGAVTAQTLRSVSILSDGTDTALISAGGELSVADSAARTSLSNIDTNTSNANGFLDSITNVLGNIDSIINITGVGDPTGAQRTASMIAVGADVVSNSNPVPISDAGGIITVDGTVSASNFPATVNTNYGAVGASTLRTASQVGNSSGAADFDLGSPGAQTLRTAAMLGVGSTAVSNGNPVPISDAGGVITVDGTVAATQSGTWTVQPGNTANTTPWLVNTSGKSFSDSAFLDYSSTSVGAGAWVQIDASTAAAFTSVTIFSGCADVLELGTGAAAAETRVMLIPPGGIDAQVALTIAAGTRLSLRSASGGTCSTGYLALTGYN